LEEYNRQTRRRMENKVACLNVRSQRCAMVRRDQDYVVRCCTLIQRPFAAYDPRLGRPCPRQLTGRGEDFGRRLTCRNHTQDVYQIPRNTGILASSLKTPGNRGTPTRGNADSLSIMIYRIHMTQAPLYPVPPCCFCEECLEDVHLEPVRASTKGNVDSRGTYIAMAMTANVSKTAYQNRRLGKERRDGVNGTYARSVSTAHLCVDFTVENPRFSRV